MYLSVKGIFELILVIFIALLLVSCSSSKGQPETALEEQEEAKAGEEQPPSLEAGSRQPIFVYNNQTANSPHKVTLKLNAEPLLLPNGYVRLVGVVSGPVRRSPDGRRDEGGGNPLALIEVGGRGLCVGVGDKVGDYNVARISGKEIQLIKGGE